MRKCCCCVPILAGATVVGLMALVVSIVELVPLVPFLAETSLEDGGFNPIAENLNSFFYMLEDTMISLNFTRAEAEDIASTVRGYLWSVLLGEAVAAGAYFLVSLLMVVGVQCDVRGLMLPYLVVEMIYLVLGILAGLAVAVALFFFNFIMGVVGAVVLFILAFVLVYLWVVVQRAYVELGNRDYMYSPAPVNCKDVPSGSPFHNGGYGGYGGANSSASGLYPTAPQHFQMHDKC